MARVIVTGASGFVGSALVKSLISGGHDVVGISRRPPTGISSRNFSHAAIDLASADNFPTGVFQGVEAVFHTAAKVSMWGRYADFYRTNVLGTKALLKGAQDAGVKKFIYTSSPSVVANGCNLRGVDETQPIPAHHEAFYPATKALAERMVLAANGQAIKTLALRPHLIFGPGDMNLIPTVISKARSGRLKRIGEAECLADFTYIDDCVTAHVLALDALDKNPSAAGRPYFISQGSPVSLWRWIDLVLAMHGLAPLNRRVSKPSALFAARLMETIARFVPFFEPALTRFLVSEMSTDHYFDISAARRELGYEPSCSVIEALGRTALAIGLRPLERDA